MDRLTKLIDDEWREDHDRDTRCWKNGSRACMSKLAEYENTGLTSAEVAELAQARDDGRLVVLPCKMGDTVFSLWGRVDSKKQYIRSAIITVANLMYYLSRIQCGTTFTTRQEAEKALERMEVSE